MNQHTKPALQTISKGRPDCGDADVIIIGAGAAGLSTAHYLRQAGLHVRILDRADQVAVPWLKRHPQLRLNTHRSLSHLPGLRIPREAGVFPDRDSIVRYLRDYAACTGVSVEFGTDIQRISRGRAGWDLTTSKGPLRSRHVVVATGRESIPYIPDWQGRQTHTGKLIHAADLGDVRQYRGKNVLVVGAGNSGTDVLNHISRIETRSLHVSIRHGPTIVPKRFLGLHPQRMAPVMERLPVRLVDRMLSDMQRRAFGRLSKFGFRQHALGAASRMRMHGVSPAIDEGFVSALKSGRAVIVPEIRGFDETGVVFADGRRLEPDIVIAATGYRTGLHPMLGHLNVLDDQGVPLVNGAECPEHCPGLWFIGMRPSMSGFFRAASIQSAQISKRICDDVAMRSGSHSITRG